MAMKNKKLTVTIGIPAYNEEANIGQLIVSLFSQKGKTFLLKNIIVVSDKSTDKTDSIVKSFKNRKIILLRNRIRLGQALSQNKIKDISSSDVLVLLNGDILIPNDDFIEKIIHPFIFDEKVGLVCPRTIPLEAITLFEKIINYSVKMKTSIFEEWNNGNNLYTCRGTARAFSSAFIKTFSWTRVVGEDAYTYLYVISRGMRYKYQKNNLIFYKSPTNFIDHRRQSRRFFSNFKELLKYFSKDLVIREFNIPKYIFFKNLLKFLLVSPLMFIAYFTIAIFVNLIPGGKINSAWVPSVSTKRLITSNEI